MLNQSMKDEDLSYEKENIHKGLGHYFTDSDSSQYDISEFIYEYENW